MAELVRDNRIWFGETGNSKPRYKRFRSDVRDTIPAQTLWNFDQVGHTDEGTKELAKLFSGTQSPFPNPKPMRLIQRASAIGSSKDGIVLDFFAGSGTTAHAAWQQNAIDAGCRRFILVQLAEGLDPARKEDRATVECCDLIKKPRNIAEITKERLRQAGALVAKENATIAPNLDIGFRVLKIDTSNMKDVYYAPDAVKQDDLVAHTDNIKPDRTPEDLLFQVLVDWGVDLSLPIEQQTIAGKTVFFVDGNALAACFDPQIGEDLVKELAKRKPLRAVFRDSSYASDSTKINVEQIFKLLSPETEVKSL
jgi:adenine-specific DNA-methyltransferase